MNIGFCSRACLCVAYYFGVENIKDFVLVLLIGDKSFIARVVKFESLIFETEEFLVHLS